MNTQSIKLNNVAYLQTDLKTEILAMDAEKVGIHGFAKLEEETWIPTKARPFNYLLSTENREEYWYHCFIHDRNFERLWNNSEKYVPYLKQAQGFISTDFSLYRSMSEDELVWNCRRNRAHAYAMQKEGVKVIPTAGFGPEYTWEWCFDGLPMNSTVAITTNGVLSDPEARRIFVGGVDALVNKLHPYAIVVCGNYPSWLKEKYPEIIIVKIPNFGQMRRAA